MTAGETTVQDVAYIYDSLNRLLQVQQGNVTEAAYTYDANGNRATLTYANGVVESYSYNKANWVTAVTNTKDSATLSSFAYTYYASGNRYANGIPNCLTSQQARPFANANGRAFVSLCFVHFRKFDNLQSKSVAKRKTNCLLI